MKWRIERNSRRGTWTFLGMDVKRILFFRFFFFFPFIFYLLILLRTFIYTCLNCIDTVHRSRELQYRSESLTRRHRSACIHVTSIYICLWTNKLTGDTFYLLLKKYVFFFVSNRTPHVAQSASMDCGMVCRRGWENGNEIKEKKGNKTKKKKWICSEWPCLFSRIVEYFESILLL